jgi:hypothetical protein
MHNIDSTQTEYTGESSQESSFEVSGESSGTQGEFQGENYEYQEMSGESLEALFNEADEMALAAELLEVSNEQELEQFLGRLIKKAGRFVSKVAKSPIGSAIGGVLKNVAKVGLPIAGGALGTFLGGPIGGMVGKKLGSFVGGQLEQENLEMQQEQEFEIARQFVRTAGAALRYANRPGLLRGNPRLVARSAVWRASRRFAPYLSTNFRQRRYRRSGGGFGAGRQWNPPRGPRGYYGQSWGDVPDTADGSFDDGDAGPVDLDQGESAHAEYAGEFNQGEYVGESMPGEFGQGEVPLGPPRPYARSGRWHRRGRMIVLML